MPLGHADAARRQTLTRIAAMKTRRHETEKNAPWKAKGGSSLRRLADATTRVHKHASGKGSAFHIRPAKPKMLATLKHALLSGSVPTSAAEIAASVKADGRSPLSTRQRLRFDKMTGVYNAKPSPNAKPKTTMKKGERLKAASYRWLLKLPQYDRPEPK